MSVFLDLKKAFDTVDHDILLSKLSALGVIEKTHCWFTLYLRNREQFCRVDGQNSSTKSVNCGIPQGSCLGPLLFIIYVNDFERCLQGATPNMYADDTSITCSSTDSDSLLRNINNEMTSIAEWMRLNKLSLNADKSEFMVIGYSRQHNVLNELREIVDGQNSSTKSVNCGIPQGSCLGPLLFIIYVNDFERCLQGATPNMYADDTSITCSSTDSDSLLRNINNEMTSIAEWMRQNKLSLNADKSEFMVIGHSRQHNVINELREIEVNHKKINRVTNTKYLAKI